MRRSSHRGPCRRWRRAARRLREGSAAHACVCVCACVCARARACVCVCGWVGGWVGVGVGVWSGEGASAAQAAMRAALLPEAAISHEPLSVPLRSLTSHAHRDAPFHVGGCIVGVCDGHINLRVAEGGAFMRAAQQPRSGAAHEKMRPTSFDAVSSSGLTTNGRYGAKSAPRHAARRAMDVCVYV